MDSIESAVPGTLNTQQQLQQSTMLTVPSSKRISIASTLPTSHMSTPIIEILEEQYKLAENFANAQASFLNAWMNNPSSAREDETAKSVFAAFEQLDNCRNSLRSNWKKIQGDEEFCIKYNHHIELSRRAILTLTKNPAWSSNGFPSHSQGTLEANTVALASLRASIALVKEGESQ